MSGACHASMPLRLRVHCFEPRLTLGLHTQLPVVLVSGELTGGRLHDGRAASTRRKQLYLFSHLRVRFREQQDRLIFAHHVY